MLKKALPKIAPTSATHFGQKSIRAWPRRFKHIYRNRDNINRPWRTLFFLLAIKASNVALAQRDAVPSIVVNNFANRPFGNVLTPSNASRLLNVNFKVVKKSAIGIANATKNDTLFSLQHGRSILYFFKNAHSVFFTGADIFDREIMLRQGIHVGITRLEFFKKLGLASISPSDVVIITDSDDFAHHRFEFNNDKLVKITLNNGID